MMKRTGYQNIFSDEKKIISLDEFWNTLHHIYLPNNLKQK